MNNLSKISTLCLLVLTVCCTKTGPLSIIEQKAVVEAYLSPNKPIDVYVTKEIPFTDSTTTLQTINNLVIKIETNGQTYTLKADSIAGHYKSTVNVVESQTYKMSFVYNGKTLSATTTIPTRPKDFKASATELVIPQFTFGGPPQFPSPVTLTWTNATSDYHLVTVKSTSTSSETINPNRPGGNRIFRERPTQTNTVDIRAPQFTYYGSHDVLLYHINVEYVSLYDDSGSNSLNLTAPYTNIENGLGIFTGISADTLKLLVKKQ
jgi:Domain of unknown function (DUF4249)